MSRFEKVINALEKHQVGGLEGVRRELDDFRIENSKWKNDYEDMNQRKLEEVHQAIKQVNSSMLKTENDWKDRCDVIQAESKMLESALQAQISDVKERILDGDSNADERIRLMQQKMQGRIKDQIDESLVELKNRFNENLELIESKFKQNNDQIKAYVER